jgi:predicted nucleic acid-binding protein
MNGADSFFVDTNVFLYQIDAVNAAKRQTARQWTLALVDRVAGRVSWQVIFEFYANAVRGNRSAAVARAAVEEMVLWNPEQPGKAMIHRAWHWCDSAKINFWDALIVAAAEQSGCRWLLSEDFQSGRRFGAVSVVNPFERQPAEFGLQ